MIRKNFNCQESHESQKLLKINKTKTNINCLINKKFKFNSAFDQKGAKNFLKSKKIALQPIILDDKSDSCSETGRNQRKINLIKKKRYSKGKRTLIDNAKKNKIRSCTNICFIDQDIKFNNNNDNIKNSKDFRYSSKKDLIKKKKIIRYFSSHELKMFGNKEIKKIKSIKKNKKKLNSQQNFGDLSFLEKNDNSIIDILSEMF